MAEMRKCQNCGAAIPPQDLSQGRAGLVAGKILCSACQQKRKLAVARAGAATRAQSNPQRSEMPTGQGLKVSLSSEPIGSGGAAGPQSGDGRVQKSTRIRTFGDEGGVSGMAFDDSRLKRPITLTGEGATRCRVFHGRLNDGSLRYMNEQINDWLDSREIEVKQASTTIGVFEGKSAEQHLIVTIFY